MAATSSGQHSGDQAPETPLAAKHHLGFLPRILTGVAFAVALGGSIWSEGTADPSIGFHPWPGVVLLLIVGGLTAAIANPKQDKIAVIIGIWAMVVAYVGMVVGGAMVGITEALAPHLAPPGWDNLWYGLGVRIGLGSLPLWMLVALLTLVIGAIQENPFERDVDYWRHGPSR